MERMQLHSVKRLGFVVSTYECLLLLVESLVYSWYSLIPTALSTGNDAYSNIVELDNNSLFCKQFRPILLDLAVLLEIQA